MWSLPMMPLVRSKYREPLGRSHPNHIGTLQPKFLDMFNLDQFGSCCTAPSPPPQVSVCPRGGRIPAYNGEGDVYPSMHWAGCVCLGVSSKVGICPGGCLLRGVSAGIPSVPWDSLEVKEIVQVRWNKDIQSSTRWGNLKNNWMSHLNWMRWTYLDSDVNRWVGFLTVIPRLCGKNEQASRKWRELKIPRYSCISAHSHVTLVNGGPRMWEKRLHLVVSS